MANPISALFSLPGNLIYGTQPKLNPQYQPIVDENGNIIPQQNGQLPYRTPSALEALLNPGLAGQEAGFNTEYQHGPIKTQEELNDAARKGNYQGTNLAEAENLPPSPALRATGRVMGRN